LSLCGKRLQALGPPGRGLSVFGDDVFVVSYPKSGNTWARFMLGNLHSQDEVVTFANIERKVPDIYQNPARVLDELPRPRVLKSHEYLDPRYRKVIYIVRDPRDVAVSYYHYLIKMRIIDDDYSMLSYVERFVRGGWDPFGSWADHVGGWVGARKGRKDFLFLRYEEMLDDPTRELKKMAEFLQFSASDQQLDLAIKMSSFERMQALEKQEGAKWTPMKLSRKDKPFVRKAKKAGWRTELSTEAVNMIEHAWSDVMVGLGYNVGSE